MTSLKYLLHGLLLGMAATVFSSCTTTHHDVVVVHDPAPTHHVVVHHTHPAPSPAEYNVVNQYDPQSR